MAVKSKRRTAFTPRGFESVGSWQSPDGSTHADTSAPIFESMLRSPAFQALVHRQQILYVVCKSQRFGKRRPESDYPDIPQFSGEDLFYMPWETAKQYGIYAPQSESLFRRDMRALIDAGFIEIVSNGRTQHRKSVYRYSANWKTIKSA